MYKIYNPIDNDLDISRNVSFDKMIHAILALVFFFFFFFFLRKLLFILRLHYGSEKDFFIDK